MCLNRLIHRPIDLEQAPQMVGTTQRVHDGVGERARDAGLALHFESQLDERRVIVWQTGEP